MSGAALDMTLDDLIKNNKKSAPRGRGRAAGPGPARRQPNRFANRAGPYAAPKAPDTTWGHDMYAAGGRSSNIETGTKLYISNLDYGVSNEDIKELFAEVGDLKRYIIHYDRSGRSKGTAEVVFSRRQDAMAAIKRYNNVQLDGKPMKIELVGTNISTPGAGLPSAGAFGHSNVAPPLQSGQGRGGFGRSRGQGGRGRGFGGRGRGRGRDRAEKVSADDLDADLEKYHADAMQTN
ncbi:RNA-binding family protein [Perilla frutescens var. hirtella]|uniref:RNA-binding family protein n=1 Tax=Perilla frutescens var. hirtella TaxID=608512 RepID=A0AAD4PE44_PERFH|nr:RNA-binding family protein [Perilla frutescens var. hirtella]KAH6810469.1 RNA-binding family protein [Perilla frutescens var. frutescens]KAH6836588.1 RNA-binding family protein [Perilla frutescens var. hirtella]